MIWRRTLNLIRTRLLQWRGMHATKGSRVFHGVEITYPCRVSLGFNATIYQHSAILSSTRGRFSLGNASHLSSHVYVLIHDNQVIIGDHVAIGPFTALFCHSHDIHEATATFSGAYLDADISIGSNVFIGSHCVILPGTVIEDRVVLAANSVASGLLESGFLYGGSPARQIKAL